MAATLLHFPMSSGLKGRPSKPLDFFLTREEPVRYRWVQNAKLAA